MLDNIDRDNLREEVRQYFGPAEVRFNKFCITVTLKEPYLCIQDLEEDIQRFVERNLNIVHDYTSVTVSEGRFKLFPYSEVVDVTPEEASDWVDNLSLEELERLAEPFKPFTFKTDNTKLEELQIEKLKQDIETFLAVNAVAALTILEKTRDLAINMSEIEELMRFSFINGLWAKASMSDLLILQKLFNERYQQFANVYTHRS